MTTASGFELARLILEAANNIRKKEEFLEELLIDASFFGRITIGLVKACVKNSCDREEMTLDMAAKILFNQGDYRQNEIGETVSLLTQNMKAG